MTPGESRDINKSALKKKLKETKEVVENIKSMDVDVEAAEILISQAERALEEDNLEMAGTIIESTVNTTKLLKQQYFIQAASILFSSLQRSIVSLEGAGSEVSYIKDLYNRAKQKFDAGHYEEAMDYIRSAEEMVNDVKESMPEEKVPPELRGPTPPSPPSGAAKPSESAPSDLKPDQELTNSQQQMEQVSSVLIRVEQLLQEAIDAGYVVDGAEKLYSLAEDAFDYQDYKNAEKYAIQSEQSLNDILEPMRAEEAKAMVSAGAVEEESQIKIPENLPTGESFKTKDSELYSDLMPRGIIGDAPKAVEEREAPSEAEEPEAPGEAKEEIVDELAFEKKATNLLISADEKITFIKETGQNIPMAERLLAIAESYFDRGDFETVKEYAEKAIRQVEEIISRKGLTEGPGETPEEAETKEEEGEEVEPESQLGGEVGAESAPEEGLDEEDEEFFKPLDEGLAQDKSKGAKSEEIDKDRLERGLKKVKGEITEAQEMGLNIEESEDLIDQAFEQFYDNNFIKAKELGISAKKIIKDLKIKFIKKKALEMIKYAWSIIEKAGEEGLDTTAANALLQESRNHVKLGEFEIAVELAMQSLQSVQVNPEGEAE
jgi:tetratricopeptide (TPR) repeat protein